MLTAAQILNLVTADQEQSQKYVKHQFQDYGLWLSQKLGDVEHRSIYIRLAKTSPKILLEQALAFTGDYSHEPNKGKLFMWKLKQLRQEQAVKNLQTDFSYSAALSQIKRAYTAIPHVLIQKWQQEFDEDQEGVWRATAKAGLDSFKKVKVLHLGSGSGAELGLMCNLGCKGVGLDVAKPIITAAASKNTKAVFKFKSDPLSLAKQLYHLIGINRLWQQLPLGAEQQVLLSLFEHLKPGGYILLQAKVQQVESQAWKSFEWQGEKYWGLQKYNQLDHLLAASSQIGFQLKELWEHGELISLLLGRV